MNETELTELLGTGMMLFGLTRMGAAAILTMLDTVPEREELLFWMHDNQKGLTREKITAKALEIKGIKR